MAEATIWERGKTGRRGSSRCTDRASKWLATSAPTASRWHAIGAFPSGSVPVRRDVEAGVLPGEDGLAELQRVPVDDDRGQQVEAGDPVVLSFLGSVSQFAALVEVDGALEGMVSLALVQSDLGASAHVGVRGPVDHEQRAFDAADLPQGGRQLVLAGIRGELAQDQPVAGAPARRVTLPVFVCLAPLERELAEAASLGYRVMALTMHGAGAFDSNDRIAILTRPHTEDAPGVPAPAP